MLIVDANNVMHASGDGRAPDGVVRLLEAVLRSRYAGRGVVLVCDGSPGRLSPGSQGALVRLMAGNSGGTVRVVYAGPDREADDVIEQMIAAVADASHVTIVSSDARLARAAYVVGAASLDTREFLAHLEKDRDKALARASPASSALDPASVGWWMRYFGYEADGTAAPAPPRTTLPARRSAKSKEEPLPKVATPRSASPRPVPNPSDWIAEAMRMWPDVFRPDELNMDQWLEPEKRRRKPKRPPT